MSQEVLFAVIVSALLSVGALCIAYASYKQSHTSTYLNSLQSEVTKLTEHVKECEEHGKRYNNALEDCRDENVQLLRKIVFGGS